MQGIHRFVVCLFPLEPSLFKKAGAAVVCYADKLCFAIIFIDTGGGLRLCGQRIRDGSLRFCLHWLCRDHEGVVLCLRSNVCPGILPV